MWDLLEKYSRESEALAFGEFLIWCASQNFKNLDSSK
jgi:hypothetical protein